MFKRIALTPSLAAIGLVLAIATPALAKPSTEVEPWFSAFPDPDHGLVAFFNISRADFCDWAAADFEGDAPVIAPVPAHFNETSSGAVVVSLTMTSALELWPMDADADGADLCADTDTASAPWATGSAVWRYHDSDFFHFASVLELGLHRTDSYFEDGTAVVADGSGLAFHYTWQSHVIFDKDLEFREVIPFMRTHLSRG